MSFLVPRGNGALDVNVPNADNHLTTNGSNWLWAVFAVYAVTFLAWLLWTISLRRAVSAEARNATSSGTTRHEAKHGNTGTGTTQRGERIFHYLLTLAAFIGMIAYFSMASDLGSTPVQQYMNTGSTAASYDGSSGPSTPFTRQIFYARYIFWFLAWPLVLIALMLLSGLSWATILYTVATLEIWVVSWLCGALVRTSYKWGYFIFGLVAYLVVAFILLAWGAQSSRTFGANTRYSMLAALLAALWTIYPIAWGLSEGSNRLSVTGEMVFYGILDLIAIPVFGSILLALSRTLDHANLFSFTGRGRTSGRVGDGAGYGGVTTGHHVGPTAFGMNGHDAPVAAQAMV